MTIINSVREIISLPVQGFTSASQPVLGYNYGAKEYERVKKTIRTIAGVTIVYTLAVWGAGLPRFRERLSGCLAEVVIH